MNLKQIALKISPVRRARIFLRERHLRWLTRSYFNESDFDRIYHYHNRKTGGTSLNAAFWGLAGLNLQTIGKARRAVSNGLIFVRHDRSLIENGTYFFANSHIPAHRISLPPKTFTISIFRDPLERVISYYRYLNWAKNNVKSGEDPSAEELKSEHMRFKGSFLSFIDDLPRRKLLRQLYMFSPSFDVHEAKERIDQLSAVCFTETFSQDISKLGDRLGLPLLEKKERRFGHTVHITTREKKLAREALQDEYILLEDIKRPE